MTTGLMQQQQGMQQVGECLNTAAIKTQVQTIQNIMHDVMVDDCHYGTIPGCGTKKVLLKPGAEKLCLTFRLAPKYQITINNLPGYHREYDVNVDLENIITKQIMGSGGGCCSTMESKYRYRTSGRVCPNCGGTGTVIKGKQEYGGGWICYAPKGGCGTKWKDGDAAIEDQKIGKEEYADPADYYNTVKKIAMKRALVAAVIQTLAASDIFDQDLEEQFDDGIPQEQTGGKPTTRAPGSKSKKAAPAGDIKTELTDGQIKLIHAKLNQKTTEEEFHKWLKDEYKIDHITDIKAADLNAVLAYLEKLPPKGEKKDQTPATADAKTLWVKVFKFHGNNKDWAGNWLHENVGKDNPESLTLEELHKANTLIDAAIAKLSGNKK